MPNELCKHDGKSSFLRLETRAGILANQMSKTLLVCSTYSKHSIFLPFIENCYLVKVAFGKKLP